MAQLLPLLFQRFCIACCCQLFYFMVNAQHNLLLNGNFEDINNCAEYHSACGVEAWFYMNASQVELAFKESPHPVLGSITLTVYYTWQRINAFTPVVATILPCRLQKGRNYTFKGLVNVKINSMLNMKLGVAMGSHFYVPRRPFAEKMEPDSIVDIIKSPGLDFYDFEYYFTATGEEQYITFGTFIQPDTSRGTYMTKGTDRVTLTIDNFQLLPDDPNEVACPAFEQRKATIYSYDWRHKIMYNTLYTKGQLPIPLGTDDSGSLTFTQPPPKPVISDTVRLGDVLFDFNKAILTPKALQILRSVFTQEKLQHPDSIYVEGHTDSVGSVEKNLLLSQNRSSSVKNWLVQQGILPDEKIQVHAFGKSRPIATNKTPQGRSLNRRVELVIFRTE
jgi:outer membrane protein OmpA-like peptidoglycan-associated protein